MSAVLPLSCLFDPGYSTSFAFFSGNFYLWDMSQDDNIYMGSSLTNLTPTSLSLQPNRASGATIVFNSRIYVIDTVNQNGAVRYTTNGATWFAVNFDGPSGYPQLVLLGSTVFALYSSPINTFYSTTDMVTWSSITSDLPFAGSSLYYYAVLGSKIFAFPNDDIHTAVYSTTDGATWAVETLDWGIGPRREYSVFVYNSVLYLVGGQHLTYVTDYKTSSNGKVWNTVSQSPSFPGRGLCQAYVNSSGIYSIGGSNAGVGSTQVWFTSSSLYPAVTKRSL